MAAPIFFGLYMATKTNKEQLELEVGQSSPETDGEGISEVSEVTYDAPQAIALDSLKFKNFTLSDMGRTLPVGIIHEGQRLRDFTLNPYITKYDRILGQLLKGTRNKLVQVLGNFLPEIIKDIGGYSIKDLASSQSLSGPRFIQNMVLGDVLTILLNARREAQGDDIAIASVCPNCGTKNEDNPDKGRPYHDLGTIDIASVENKFHSKKLVVEVILKDGLMIFGEKITKIQMQPLRLYHAESIAKSDNTPEDMSMLYAMVCGIPESDAYNNVRGQVFSDELYDNLTMGDLAILRKAMKTLQPGPKMQIEMECYNCGHEWEELVAWGNLRQFLYVAPDSD